MSLVEPARWRSIPVAATVLRALTVLLSFLTFLTLADDIFIFHLKHDLAQPDSTVGYVLACAALGTVIAALIGRRPAAGWDSVPAGSACVRPGRVRHRRRGAGRRAYR